MSVCGAGSSPYLETVAGESTLLRLTAVGADGNPIDLTSVLVEMRVGTVAGLSPGTTGLATYSTGTNPATIIKTNAPAGIFTVQTSPTLDTTAGFFRYIITVTPSGGAAYTLAHGVYAVAQP